MADELNSSPAGVPPQLPERVASGLRAALADPNNHPSAYVRLTVAGGVSGERYEFDFLADAAGNVQGHLRDDLKGRDLRPAPLRSRPDPERFRQIGGGHRC